jgi:serine/threonine-protein kinase RsbW
MFRNVRKELITIPAQMSYLSQVRDFIEHIGRKFRYSDKVTNSFKLVIEEACTNIIRHGYRDIKGGEITLKAIIRRQSLTIVIIDQGISYDPRQANTPDLQKYIQIGKKGGLGIFMMRKLMDDVQYNITNRGNELRLTKQREFLPQTRVQSVWENLTMRTRHTIKASVAVTGMAFLIFIILYSRVEESMLQDVIENTRGQAFSLADNSSEFLQNEKYLDLFSLARTYKSNNKETIYETFIVDSARTIQSASTAFKAMGQYEIPEDAVVRSIFLIFKQGSIMT